MGFKKRLSVCLSSPQELEDLYQESPGKFSRSFPELRRENPDALYLPVYPVWLATVTFLFPLFFGLR